MVKAIELATGFEIQAIERTVYRVRGARRDYFDERTALNKLAFIIADREFKTEDKATNYPDEKIILKDGTPAHRRGEMTPEYFERVRIVLGNLKELLKKEREIKRLEKEYENAKDKRQDAEFAANEALKKLMAAQNL